MKNKSLLKKFFEENNHSFDSVNIHLKTRLAWRRDHCQGEVGEHEFVHVPKSIDFFTDSQNIESSNLIISFSQTTDVNSNEIDQLQALKSSNCLFDSTAEMIEINALFKSLIELYPAINCDNALSTQAYFSERHPNNELLGGNEIYINLGRFIKYIDLDDQIAQLNNGSGKLIDLQFERFSLTQAYIARPCSIEIYKVLRLDRSKDCLERGGSMDFTEYYNWYLKSLKLFKENTVEIDIAIELTDEGDAILTAAISEFTVNPRHNTESISYWLHRNFEIHPMHQNITTNLINKILSQKTALINYDLDSGSQQDYARTCERA